MNITKQTLFISRKAKAKELESLLSTLSQLTQNNQECVLSSVYQCNDEVNEFLLYEQWTSENSFINFRKSDIYKDFQRKSELLVLKSEVLKLD